MHKRACEHMTMCTSQGVSTCLHGSVCVCVHVHTGRGRFQPVKATGEFCPMALGKPRSFRSWASFSSCQEALGQISNLTSVPRAPPHHFGVCLEQVPHFLSPPVS